MADNRINIVISAKDQASGPLKNVSDEIDKTGHSSGRSSRLLDGFKSALGTAAVAATAAAAAAGTAATVIGFNFNSSVEQAQAKLMAFMKDGDRVAKTLDWVKQEAAATQFSFTEMADAAANLTPVAKTSGKSLEDLVRQAEILAALNPTEGLTGAVFSLREALSGDWVSIVDRFNLPRQRINELKEQGVPAMEIISRTLQEMGIDYSLVAAQGATTAARFDQIKDKLTMMAGAAAKPIFDKVSAGLDEINKKDFSAIGDQLAGFSQGLVDVGEILATGKFRKGMLGLEQENGAVKALIGLHDAFMKVLEIVRPAAEELWTAITTKLAPALDQILGDNGADAYMGMAYAIGAALWLVISVITKVVEVLAWVYQTENTILNGTKQLFADTAAFVVNAWNGVVYFFQNFPQILAFAIGYIAGLFWRFATVDVPNAVGQVVNWFAGLPGRIASAVIALWPAAVGAFNNFRASAANWALDTVNAIVNYFLGLPGRISSALSSAFNGAKGQVTDFLNNVAKGMSSGAKRNAVGTGYSPGGMTLVGEHGPELVDLPQGSQVTQAWQTRSQGLSAAPGGVSVNFYGPVAVREESDIEKLAQRIAAVMDNSGQSLARGLAA